MERYSVLMAVYYKEKSQNLQEAINSMLNQTEPPSDFVLVCDGPLTRELDLAIKQFVDQYPCLFQVVRLSKNSGLGEALRIGTQACKNELVARMDSDDIALPDRMKWQLSVLTENQNICVVGGQIQEFNEANDKLRCCRMVPTEPEKIKSFAARRNPMNHMTVTFRKTAVLAAGGYMIFDRFEDYYLWARMLAMGFQMANVDQVCVYARIDLAMYQRRGGWKYFYQSMELEKFLRSVKLCTFFQFITNVIIRFGGTVLVPNRIRQYLYLAMLRKCEQ